MASISETNTETTLQLYANPLLIQDKQLALFEEHVFDGKRVLDGNNVFTFGLEMGATLTAGIVNEMANNFQSLYPARAQTMSDLYRHLSDYDYVDMFSTPATTTIELMFERNFLIDNAPTDGDEDGALKVIIPEFSTFTIGNHIFGIHYPIEIKIRKAYKSDGITIDYDRCMFHCIWNTETVNPLYRLNTNILEHRMFNKEGLSFLCIQVPIQQFAIDIKKEDSIASTGFLKRFSYSNRFYAIRVFHYWNNQWVEMAETLSDVIYNPQILTAKVKVLSDIHTVEVSIPQSYFTAGLVGNRVMCMIYTTEGAMDVDIRNYNTNQFSASFLIDDTVVDDTYSAFLKRIPMLQVIPLASRISNGSNGKTFEEMKNRVMNSVGGDDLLVTPKQLEAHLSDTGFKVSKYIDNITDRIYLASKEITDANSDVVGAGEFMTTFNNEILAGAGEAYDTILPLSDGKSYMIMPSSIFKYDVKTDSMIPMSRYDRKNLFNDKTTEYIINELNTNNYTFTPFHIKLDTKNESPIAGTFDLMNPTVSNVTFVGENKYTSTQVSMYGSVLMHIDQGTNGYKLTVALYKTDDLKGTRVRDGLTDNLAVILRTNTIDGAPMYIRGKYIGVNSDDKDLVEFHIVTKYDITKRDDIDTRSFTLINDTAHDVSTNYVNLTQDYELLFFAHRSFITDTDAITESNNQGYIPKEILSANMVWLATQKLTISLGEAISSVRNNVFMTLTGKEYKSYNTTEFATYNSDVYERYTEDVTDATGLIIHHKGELVIDENGKLRIKHRTGDLIITSSDSESIGLKNPSCVITHTRTDADGNNIGSSQTIFLDSDHLSKVAEPSNNWYPVRAFTVPVTINQGTIDERVVNKWKLIYSGSTSRASIIETKDLLKYIIDTIDENRSDLMLENTLNKKRSSHINPMTNLYVLDNPVPGSFVYVNNSTIDDSVPTYWAYLNHDNKYVIDNNVVHSREDFITHINANRTPDEPRIDTVGAVYMRDTEFSDYDFTPYISEHNLCLMFKDLDDLDNNVAGAISEEAIRIKYDVDSIIFENLKKFRDPWIKLLETRGDNTWSFETMSSIPAGFTIVREYWNNRSYINFNNTLSIRTHGVGIQTTVSGIEALAYIQERSVNQYDIEQFDDMSGLDYVDNETNYRLVWIDNYNPNADNSAVSTVSLINDIDINEAEGEKVGALLWSTHLGDHKHYVVVTGPSFIKCYNELMSRPTMSGYIYETKVLTPTNAIFNPYRESTDITLLEGFTKPNGEEVIVEENTEIDAYKKFIENSTNWRLDERYIAVVSSTKKPELLFTEVAWHSNWPWEMTNWTVDYNRTSGEVVGKNITSAGVYMDIDRNNKDAKVVHYVGDVILDEFGKPSIEDTTIRNTIYHVSATHCDYKLTMSADKEYKMFRPDIEQLLRGYYNLLEATRPMLLERTNLYYTPIKSMGYGKFKGANGEIIDFPLEVSVDLRIHITPTTAGSSDSKDLIRNNVIQMIEQHMTSGNISCTMLAEQIRQTMSDTVLYVDVLGINGNHNVQTLVSADPSQSSVRLKSILVLRDDNTIGIEKAVNIEWAIMQ